jgi:hypothetical protein
MENAHYECSKLNNEADEFIWFSYNDKYTSDRYIMALSNKLEFYDEFKSEFEERVKSQLKSKYVSTMTELLKLVE